MRDEPNKYISAFYQMRQVSQSTFAQLLPAYGALSSLMGEGDICAFGKQDIRRCESQVIHLSFPISELSKQIMKEPTQTAKIRTSAHKAATRHIRRMAKKGQYYTLTDFISDSVIEKITRDEEHD